MNNSFAAKKIAVFDRNLKLAAIFSSLSMAAEILGVTPQVLRKACKGDVVAVKKLYIRDVPDEIIIDFDDIGVLRLTDFDGVFGKDYPIYLTAEMKPKQIIPESRYHDRFNYIKTNKYKEWKRSRLKS